MSFRPHGAAVGPRETSFAHVLPARQKRKADRFVDLERLGEARNQGARFKRAAKKRQKVGFPGEGMRLARGPLVSFRPHGAAVGPRETFHKTAFLSVSSKKRLDLRLRADR